MVPIFNFCKICSMYKHLSIDLCLLCKHSQKIGLSKRLQAEDENTTISQANSAAKTSSFTLGLLRSFLQNLSIRKYVVLLTSLNSTHSWYNIQGCQFFNRHYGDMIHAPSNWPPSSRQVLILSRRLRGDKHSTLTTDVAAEDSTYLPNSTSMLVVIMDFCTY